MADLSYTLKKFWRATDLKDKPDVAIPLTITGVERKEVGDDKSVKPVAFFAEDPRGLVLNGTNYTKLTEAHGTPDVDFWKNARVQISFDPNVRFRGQKVGGISLTILTPGKI